MVTIFGSLKEVIAIAKHKRFLTLEHIDRVIEVIPDQCFTLTDAHDALPVGEVGTVKVTPAYVRFYPWDIAPSQHSRFVGWEKSLITRFLMMSNWQGTIAAGLIAIFSNASF